MKDRFSENSSEYAKYRPDYPADMYRFIESLVQQRNVAWDCATGTGKVAIELANAFNRVEASDISRQQLHNAPKAPNINYSQQSAENADFPEDHFDLITVAQAIHWFDIHRFYPTAKRCLKPGGILAIIGYGLLESNKETDDLTGYLYKQILEPYWDDERRYIEEEYKTLPFPFDEVSTPEFTSEHSWDFEHLAGYLKTWSAVKKYEEDKGHNPVDAISEDLKKAFGERGIVRFPILLRVGKTEL